MNEDTKLITFAQEFSPVFMEACNKTKTGYLERRKSDGLCVQACYMILEGTNEFQIEEGIIEMVVDALTMEGFSETFSREMGKELYLYLSIEDMIIEYYT